MESTVGLPEICGDTSPFPKFGGQGIEVGLEHVRFELLAKDACSGAQSFGVLVRIALYLFHLVNGGPSQWKKRERTEGIHLPGSRDCLGWETTIEDDCYAG